MSKPQQTTKADDDWSPNFETESPKPTAPALTLAEKMKMAAASVAAYQPSQIYVSSQAAAQPTDESANQDALGESGEYDPNNYDINPLTGSIEMNLEGHAYSDQPPPSDPESDEVFSDDESRDLCSNPCMQCGAVPSYVLYELCENCLDKYGPQ